MNKQRRTIRLLPALAVLAILTGCGDMQLAGVGSGGTGVVKASLGASAKEGYLINAIVFLDKNTDYRLNADEPYCVTGADGSCTLTAAATDYAAWPVVVAALKGTAVDSATLQPLPATYLLTAPAGSAVNGVLTVTPISTQVRELTESGRYSSTGQAMEALAGQIGLPSGANLLAEQTAAANPALSAAAKSIAALLWMQSSRILTQGETLPQVDAERYRVMMQIIADNMAIVSRLNSPENLLNLNSNITAVLEAMPPRKAIVP